MSFQNEKIVQIKQCRQCNTNFDITDKDLEFYKKVSPVFGGKKYLIPSPNLCPDCRNRRRLLWRNERSLYKRKCDATEKTIISIGSPNKKIKFYTNEYWWSDKWDAMDYQQDFDFDKSFFDQFKELFDKVPFISLIVSNSENCDYSNYCTGGKDSYLSQRIGHSEKAYYSYLVLKSINIFDSYNIDGSENCFELIDASNCYNVFNSQNIENCRDSGYLFDCNGCENCSFSINLVNKQYYFLNKQYSKEDYEKKVKNINFREVFSEFVKLKKNAIASSIHGKNYHNCSGNYIVNGNNLDKCFDMRDVENMKYCNGHIVGENSMDTDFNYMGSYNYENIACGESNKLYFSFNNLLGCDSLFYCVNCYGSSNLFGCTGLKNKQYCILNKQYTKEEYNKLVPKIIEHMKTPLLNKEGLGVVEWGEFFPSSISPFGYNETVASEYFSLKKEEAIKQGFNWSDYEAPHTKVDKIILANKLPEKIEDIPDDILNWAIECEVTKKPFRIIKAELEFYRKHNLPIPKRHPDQRHLDRMKLRNPRKLFDRECDKCSKDIETTYAPDRTEKVYCEECYNKEVY